MKFLIQKINNKVQHDFSFTLLKAIEYANWLNNDNAIKVKYINSYYNSDFEFSEFHVNYVPVGSVEFVTAYIRQFYGVFPCPMNVPEELFGFTCREIENVCHMDLEDKTGEYFVKSNEKIKGYCERIDLGCNKDGYKFQELDIPAGYYQISRIIDIESEWRCFVYNGKLVGTQHYSGDFRIFPRLELVDKMIDTYKSAPIAYTLDVGISGIDTFVIECHDFFSCGLYGFSDLRILPQMFHRSFKELIKKYEE